MYRKDYIEKLVEQLTNALAVVLHLVKKDDLQQAHEAFALELENFSNVTYDKFLVKDCDDWFEELLKEYGNKSEFLEALAHLLLQGAELAFNTNRITEGFMLTTKCQKVYNYLIANDLTYSQVREGNIERLAILISKFSN